MIFPSHSMDTTWYGVDKDGHLAVFWSGESGAVPFEAMPAPKKLPRLQKQLDLKTIVEHTLTYPCTGNCYSTSDFIVLKEKNKTTTTILLSQTDDKLQKEILIKLLKDGYVRLITTTTTFASFEGFADFKIHWNDPFLNKIKKFVIMSHAEVTCTEDCLTHGAFVYSHPLFNNNSFPYSLELIPTKPIVIEKVPNKVATFREFCFYKKHVIQPLQYKMCEVYDSGYYYCWIKE